jgi:glutamyl-tRNA reductase
VSHRTADLALRERLALAGDRLAQGYARLRERGGASEALVLSTCNRVEVYAAGPVPPSQETLASFFPDLDAEMLARHGYALSDGEAAAHCFRVVAGLEAMALGETQVLAQAKEAYCLALEHETVGPVLHGLFQQAFATAKRIHAETTLGQRKISVSSVAVDLAGKIFQDLSQRTALVLGAGDMGELTVKHLIEAGVRQLLVVNRTLANAEALAARHGGTALPLGALEATLPRVDILISSAGGEGFLVTPGMVREALRHRRQRPLFFIDIAVPRNVHPGVKDLDNVYLYDIDDLEKVVEENLKGRAGEIKACAPILDAAVTDFLHDRALRSDLQPVIRALRDRLHGIRERELTRIAASLPAGVRGDVADAMNRLVNKILHDPIEALKAEAREVNGATTAEALKRLFRL